MALENRDSGKYFSVYEGKFSQRQDNKLWENATDEELKKAGVFKRINKLGKTVFEKYFDSFTGTLINIKTQDSSFGKNWLFVFKDGEDIWNLNLGYSNTYATAFLKMLPNIDLTQPIKLSPSVKKVDGKDKSSLFVNQGSEHVKHAYTREVPNGMPDMVQIMVKGVPTWDDTDRLVFLQNMVNTVILPKLGKDVPEKTDTLDELAGTSQNPEDQPF